jgi:predicted RNase H-like HicB family nuclease
MRRIKLTAIIQREGDGYVSLCPELDVASQGESVGEARINLLEAVEAFFEVASKQEVEQRLAGERYVEQMEVSVG